MARLLIVEDNGDLQAMLSVIFNREGYDVHYAFNGQEGYEKILALQPDVILLDLMMPVLDGFEVLKLVAANTAVRDIPIIVMTAHGDRPEKLEQTLRDQGVREYVRKPFENAQIKGAVRRLLTQYPRRPPEVSQVSKGRLRLDVKLRTVWLDDRHLATLPPTRADVLRVLLQAPGPVAKEKLLKDVWGEDGSLAALEKTISRLREDLGADAADRLQTTGDGYELIG